MLSSVHDSASRFSLRHSVIDRFVSKCSAFRHNLTYQNALFRARSSMFVVQNLFDTTDNKIFDSSNIGCAILDDIGGNVSTLAITCEVAGASLEYVIARRSASLAWQTSRLFIALYARIQSAWDKCRE